MSGLIPGFDASSLMPWVVPCTGIAATALVFMIAQKIMGKRQPVLEPPPTSSHRPESDPFLMGSPTDRRRSVRRVGNPMHVRVADESTTKELFEGWILDRSMGGLRVMVPEEVKVGTILCVRTPSHGNHYPWAKIEVQNCVPNERNSFALGCKFVKPLPWGELLLFG
jgi:hypothetical protein